MTKRDTLSQTLDTVLSMNDSEREHELESMGRVQRWKADGLVTTDSVMYRLTKSFKKSLSPEKFHHFIQCFDSFCELESSNAVKAWQDTAFQSFLSRPFPASFPPIEDAGKLLYRSTLKLAAFPFLSKESSQLDSEALLRGAGTFTGRHEYVFSGWGTFDEYYEPKVRDETDRRRLLFRSFAVSGQGTTTEKQNALKDKRHKEDENNILDVLAYTQPGARPGLTPVSSKSIRTLLKSLPTSEVHVCDLTIPHEEFLTLLKLLIISFPDQAGVFAEQFAEDLHGVDEVADHLLTAIFNKGEDGITWESFNSTITQSLPDLLMPLPRLFEPLFTPADPDPPEPMLPKPNPSKILTYPVLSHLGMFVPNPIFFNDLRCLYSTHPGPTSLDTLILRVLPWQGKSMLLVSGTVEGESLIDKTSHVTYGAFIPEYWQEGSTFGSTRSQIFQLAPTHFVFRGSGSATNYATLTKSGIAFGTPIPTTEDTSSGHIPTSLVLDADLAGGVFTVGTGEGTYRASGTAAQAEGKEMSWSRRFVIQNLEIWGLGPPDDHVWDED